MGAPRPVRSVRWWSPRWAGIGLLLLLASGILAGCGSPDLSTSPTPEPRLPLLVAQEGDNPMGRAVEIRDGDCVGSADIFPQTPDLGPVDAAIFLRLGAHGLYDADKVTVFFGPVEEAAAGFGGTALFVGPQETWIRIGPGSARKLIPFTTPSGHEVWMMTDTAQTGVCGTG